MTGENAQTLFATDPTGSAFANYTFDIAKGTAPVVLSEPLRELIGCAGARDLTLEDIRARIHSADRQRIAEEVSAALRDPSKSLVRTRFRIVLADGSAAWVEAIDQIERDGDGRAIHSTGSMRLVTGRKEADRPIGTLSKPAQAVGDRETLLDRMRVCEDAGIGDRGLFSISNDILRRKLNAYAELSLEDATLLIALERKRRFVPARQQVKVTGTAAGQSWLIGNGWVYSYKALVNGERQVLGFHLPGDLIRATDRDPDAGCSYVAVTDCVVCEFDRSLLMRLRRSETMLPDALQWSDAREEAILHQHLISIGRRSAIASVAHLLLELGSRLKLVGLADDHGYKCPLSQELIGDALGLTKIHVNRMLRELRERGCLTFKGGYVTFDDIERLSDLAEYDPGYLGLRQPQPPALATLGA
jgi:PAS domain S-box-containing protein